MFIGHYAVGLGAKRAAPRVSLGTLFLSVQLLDLIWPILILLGVEHVRIDPGNTRFTPLDFYDYPISHGLVPVLGMALAFGVVYFFRRRSVKEASIVGIGVVSHWILDFISHRPDMPIIPGSGLKLGLGLWNSVPWTIVSEGALFLAGVVLYSRSTAAVDRTGKYAYWWLVGFLVVAYIANLFSPPPPSVTAIGIGGIMLWLIVPWGYWIDRHRKALDPSGAST